MDITTLDFNTLNAKEKKELIDTLDKALNETTEAFSFQQKILMQTLFVARSYHFYQQLLERLQRTVPALYQDIMEHIWISLLEEISIEELKEFYRATTSVFTCLFTGDDEYLDEVAWEKYEAEWDSFSCGVCLLGAVMPDDILEQIVSGEINYARLDNHLINSISEYISEGSLENIYKKETSGYKYAELERHNTEIYNSPTFSYIFALFQEDVRLVKELGNPTKEDILKLKKQYQEKGLFNQQQLEKIADWLKQFYF